MDRIHQTNRQYQNSCVRIGILVDGTQAMILSPYSAKKDVKSLDGARWNGECKGWIISAGGNWAADVLRKRGYTVTVREQEGGIADRAAYLQAMRNGLLT